FIGMTASPPNGFSLIPLGTKTAGHVTESALSCRHNDDYIRRQHFPPVPTRAMRRNDLDAPYSRLGNVYKYTIWVFFPVSTGLGSFGWRAIYIPKWNAAGQLRRYQRLCFQFSPIQHPSIQPRNCSRRLWLAGTPLRRMDIWSRQQTCFVRRHDVRVRENPLFSFAGIWRLLPGFFIRDQRLLLRELSGESHCNNVQADANGSSPAHSIDVRVLESPRFFRLLVIPLRRLGYYG